MEKYKILLISFVIQAILGLNAFCQTNNSHTYVRPFFKKDGTFVEGYWRTSPNNTNRDNFSTKGNENPYNGKIGWIEPDNNNLNTYNQ